MEQIQVQLEQKCFLLVTERMDLESRLLLRHSLSQTHLDAETLLEMASSPLITQIFCAAIQHLRA